MKYMEMLVIVCMVLESFDLCASSRLLYRPAMDYKSMLRNSDVDYNYTSKGNEVGVKAPKYITDANSSELSKSVLAAQQQKAQSQKLNPKNINIADYDNVDSSIVSQDNPTHVLDWKKFVLQPDVMQKTKLGIDVNENKLAVSSQQESQGLSVPREIAPIQAQDSSQLVMADESILEHAQSSQGHAQPTLNISQSEILNQQVSKPVAESVMQSNLSKSLPVVSEADSLVQKKPIVQSQIRSLKSNKKNSVTAREVNPDVSQQQEVSENESFAGIYNEKNVFMENNPLRKNKVNDVNKQSDSANIQDKLASWQKEIIVNTDTSFESLKKQSDADLISALSVASFTATQDTPITKPKILSALISKMADEYGITKAIDYLRSKNKVEEASKIEEQVASVEKQANEALLNPDNSSTNVLYFLTTALGAIASAVLVLLL